MLWIKRHERPARPIKTQENGQISFCIISLRQGSNAAWTTKVGRVKAGLLTSPPSRRRLPGDDAYHRMFATSGMSAARCVIRELQQRVLFRIFTWFPFDPSPFHAREPQHVQFIAAKIQQYFWDYNKKRKGKQQTINAKRYRTYRVTTRQLQQLKRRSWFSIPVYWGPRILSIRALMSAILTSPSQFTSLM